ncbi:MAG: hypothetical protein ACK5Q5_10470 [Planctomycetaceae bacterium]
MQNPLFKLTALASVIGAGMTVVYEAQQQLGGTLGIEQFAPLADEAKPASTGEEVALQSEPPTLAAALTEPNPGSAPSEIKVSGPTTGDTPRGDALGDAVPSSSSDAFAFLYSGASTPASQPNEIAPQQPSLDVADFAGNAEPIADAGLIQQASAEHPAEEPSGLMPFPVPGGAPTLLTPPDAPPTPPRPGKELLSSLAPAAMEVVQAEYDSLQQDVTKLAEQTGGVELAAATSNLLAQADPFPAGNDRTREPAPLPATLNQSEPLDLFGPLPSTESPPPSADLLPPGAASSDTLVLPAGSTATAGPATTSDDPFPSAIPGTEPAPADFLPQSDSVPAPRERSPVATPTPSTPSPTPALFPAVNPPPPTTSPTAAAAPLEGLFLPEEPRPANPSASDTMVLPPATAGGDDPFATGSAPYATAAPAPVPTPAPTPVPTSTPAPVPGNLTAAAPATPPPDRTRTQPTPPPTMTQSGPAVTSAPAPTGDSPFFSSEPAPVPVPAAIPRRTAEPTPALDPFPTMRAPESTPAPVNAYPQTFPEPNRSSIPTRTEPAAPVPNFPTLNDAGGSTPIPTPSPSRSSIPLNTAPVPATTPLTFPERSSLPATNAVPTRSPSLDYNATPAPSRSTSDPFPQPSDLAGTGMFDSSAPAGMQPELQIEKEAPPKAVLNQELIYAIRVRNVGRSVAHQVVVEDGIPKGSRLEGTNPEAELDPTDKHLIWRFGALAPGEEKVIRVKVVPTEPGEIGSVATVRFVGRIAAKTIITAPKVRLEMNGPAETAVGDVPVYRLRITNVGDGDATNVAIKSALPQLFQHPSGNELEYTVGALPAGQSRDLELALSAIKPGQASQTFVALIDDKEQDRTVADVVVLASRLSIERTGPEKRFVNRPANYVTQVTNQSGDTLRNVTVVETLPAGVELAAVPQHGRYDASRRTVTWVIPQLGPQETQQINSSLVTADQGNYATSVQVWDAAGNKAEATSQLQVAGFSSLKVDVAQVTQGGGEVAVGDQVALRMTVANRGSAPATEVVTEFEIPPELEFVAAKPQQYELVDRKVRFQSLPQLEINGQQVIDIVCVARQPGRPQIAASIWSKEQSPIRQEEAVVVFREDP